MIGLGSMVKDDLGPDRVFDFIHTLGVDPDIALRVGIQIFFKSGIESTACFDRDVCLRADIQNLRVGNDITLQVGIQIFFKSGIESTVCFDRDVRLRADIENAV